MTTREGVEPGRANLPQSEYMRRVMYKSLTILDIA